MFNITRWFAKEAHTAPTPTPSAHQHTNGNEIKATSGVSQ